MLIENDNSFSIKAELNESVIPKCLLTADDSQLMADRWLDAYQHF